VKDKDENTVLQPVLYKNIDGSLTLHPPKANVSHTPAPTKKVKPEKTVVEEVKPAIATEEKVKPEKAAVEEVKPEKATVVKAKPEKATVEKVKPEKATEEEVKIDEATGIVQVPKGDDTAVAGCEDSGKVSATYKVMSFNSATAKERGARSILKQAAAKGATHIRWTVKSKIIGANYTFKAQSYICKK